MERLSRSHLGSLIALRDVGGMRVSSARYFGASSLPLHEHGHAYLCLVADGLYSQRSGRHEDVCRRGLLLVHPDGHRHANHFSEHGARCLNIHLPPLPASAPIHQLLCDYRRLHLPGVGGLLARIESELLADDPAADLALQAAVLDLVAHACRTHPVERHPVWMRRVLQRLHDDPITTPSLHELAQLAGVHAAHLARSFRRAHGLSVGEYLRELRLQRACAALRESRDSIAEIAAEAGFADQSHFARIFRRRTGQTPSRYRHTMQRLS